MNTAPGDGGRRSRRGFAYQDAITLAHCLDLFEGKYVSVAWEAKEDIECRESNRVSYTQVKTLEDVNKRFSLASMCKRKRGQGPEHSILGKLFLGKTGNDGDRYVLVLNETPTADLFAFTTSSNGVPSAETTLRVSAALDGIRLPAGRNIEWCLSRLIVRVESREIEELENAIFRRLFPIAGGISGTSPLDSEIESLLTMLLAEVAREARQPTAREFNVEDITNLLRRTAVQVMGRDAFGHEKPLESLTSKLVPVRLPESEERGVHAQLRKFRLERRSAVGARSVALDQFSDEVHAVCTELMSQRRSGILEPGPPAYHATVTRISQLPEVVSTSISRALAQGALADVTARCLNRYADG